MPRFSIIVPVYNVEPYLQECLDSIFSQDFKDFEVCIVNDGSLDGSSKICEDFLHRYPDQIKYFTQKNQGVSVARNQAMDMASGEYLWFVDADDYINSNKALEYINTELLASGCDTIFFGSEHYNNQTAGYFEEAEKSSFLQSHICFCNPLMIFKRSIIAENQIKFTAGMKMGEDLEFQYKYLIHCNRPIAIEYNFYHIREREGSASRSDSSYNDNLNGNSLILKNMISYIEPFEAGEIKWMSSRIAERLKSYLQSCSMVNDVDWTSVNREYRAFVDKFESLGLEGLKTGSLRLALLHVRLYCMAFKTLTLMKK